MILIEQHPDGYSLRRSEDPPTTPPLIVAEDELAETVAALFAEDELGGYATGWDRMVAATATAVAA